MGPTVTPPEQVERSERFFTTEEVAARYRTSPATVRWWRQTGTYGPKGIKVGRRVLYPRAEIDRFEQQLAAEQEWA
jgi:hypothetical protein